MNKLLTKFKINNIFYFNIMKIFNKSKKSLSKLMIKENFLNKKTLFHAQLF